MRTRKIWVVAGVILALFGAEQLPASNMAFKLNYRLNAPTAGVSATGNNTLALPYLRQSGINSSTDLLLDIGGGSLTPVLKVSKFNKDNDTFRPFTGRRGGPLPYLLTTGEGYFVQMATDVNYIVIGSHDPSFALQLNAPQPGVSSTGKNFIALPYNTTSTNAFQVMLDIGGGSIAPVLNISRFNPATDTFSVYTGRMGSGSPFPIVNGEAYFVSMAATVAYVPSHY
jgi:hypothetical protein